MQHVDDLDGGDGDTIYQQIIGVYDQLSGTGNSAKSVEVGMKR